ncbi:MAG TPA: phospholipase [Thermoanaerobaculia bacterium]|nr:phospholipase [Thermoanaerobaculia bacterium]
MLSRRRLLALSAAAGLLGCASPLAEEVDSASAAGRIDARPSSPATAGARGSRRIGSGTLYVPESYDPRRAVPLIVILHGAGGAPEGMMNLMRPHADRTGAIVFAPKSIGATWDVIQATLGPDVDRLDDALADVFARYLIDPERIAVGGFSDGASYALTIGIANGDLFTHILAFSPGFLSAPAQHGTPGVYVSHGTDDRVLPVDRCSRVLVPRLQSAGYSVLYREFTGPHTVPPDVATEAIDWFASM